MGIKGLWKEVQPACRPGHISQFRGLRVGVDAYCWLHRAVISCTLELATDKPCDKYITFMMSRVDLLLRYGVTPVMVFDGDSMPMKGGTDAERKSRRARAHEAGMELLQHGATEEAIRQLEKSLEVTTEIAYSVIVALKRRGIECMVAPFEADAQLGYLAKEGYVHAVLSEDSDLIVYHAATLLAKMDGHGNCDCLQMQDLTTLPLMSRMSYESFVVACIMSGCDYLPSLPSVGVKTAFRLVGGGGGGGSTNGGGGGGSAAKKSVAAIMAALVTQHGFTQRELQPYEEQLHKAFYCFRHHLVYDPNTKEVVPFSVLPAGTEVRADLIGEIWTPEVAVKVCATFELDPITRQPYTGAQQKNVDAYFQRTERGQTSLTSFRAFEKFQSNKILLASQSSSTTINPTKKSSLDDSPLERKRTVKGFLGQSTTTTVIVKSKYWSGGSIEEESPMDPTTSDEEDAAAAVLDGSQSRKTNNSNEVRGGAAKSTLTNGGAPSSTIMTEVDPNSQGQHVASSSLTARCLFSAPPPAPLTTTTVSVRALTASSYSQSQSTIASQSSPPLESPSPTAGSPLLPFAAGGDDNSSFIETNNPPPSSFSSSLSTFSSRHQSIHHSNNNNNNNNKKAATIVTASSCPQSNPNCSGGHSVFMKCIETTTSPALGPPSSSSLSNTASMLRKRPRGGTPMLSAPPPPEGENPSSSSSQHSSSQPSSSSSLLKPSRIDALRQALALHQQTPPKSAARADPNNDDEGATATLRSSVATAGGGTRPAGLRAHPSAVAAVSASTAAAASLFDKLAFHGLRKTSS